MKRYQLNLLTKSGPVNVVYTTAEPLADFEKRMTNTYGTFIQLSCKEIN